MLFYIVNLYSKTKGKLLMDFHKIFIIYLISISIQSQYTGTSIGTNK